MAILTQGILGAFSGKCGPIIGYLRNGKPCIRSMPSHYHDRRSPEQLHNRSRFTPVMKMMSLVRPAITLGFKRFATDMTEMNCATRANYYTLVKGQPQHLHYDYSGLILSQGNVEPLSDLILTSHSNTLTLLWNSQSVPGGSQDQVSVLLLNANRMAMKFFHGIALRQDGTATLALPTHWQDEETYLYTMVQRADNWSPSACAGTIPNNQQPTPSNLSNPSNPSNPSSTPFPKASPHPAYHKTPLKVLFPSPLKGDKSAPPPPQNSPT